MLEEYVNDNYYAVGPLVLCTFSYFQRENHLKCIVDGWTDGKLKSYIASCLASVLVFVLLFLFLGQNLPKLIMGHIYL